MEAFSNDIWFIHVQVPESMLAHTHTQHKTHSCTQAHMKNVLKFTPISIIHSLKYSHGLKSITD